MIFLSIIYINMSSSIKNTRPSYSSDLVRTIIINSSHFKKGSGATYVYDFPSTVYFDGTSGVGISSVAIYNSTFNITSVRGNNTISLIWNTNDTATTYNFTIPDGYYSVADLNYFIQYKCIENDLYVISGSNYIYFLELATNATQYSIQLNSYNIPTATEASNLGYTKPISATWDFPATTSSNTPQLIVSSAFGNLIGFNVGTYPTVPESSDVSILSQKTPIISPISTYVVRCNLINSKFSNPSDVLAQVPLNASLGSLINYSPSDVHFNKISSNSYKQIILTFCDQYFAELDLRDIDVSISLVVIEENG